MADFGQNKKIDSSELEMLWTLLLQLLICFTSEV